MDIVRLLHSDFDDWEKGILLLLREAIERSFPHQNIPENYYTVKSKEIKQYLIDDKAIIYLALQDGELIGWVWGHEIYRFKKRRLHIASIAISPQWQKNGIGKELLAKMEEYGSIHKYDDIELFAVASNDNAVNFYEHLEFEKERYLMIKKLE